MLDPNKFGTNEEITWCKGCGNFGIFVALKNAFDKLGWKPNDVLLTYGIGCHGHMVNYLNAFGFEGLHGRALPVATGAKLANHKLNVISIVGDGDQLGEGGNHFLHACRRNTDITCIIHDNQVYGLTVGQSSPTSAIGFKSRTAPTGTVEEPINPVSLALAAGAPFVAQGFSGDIKQLTDLFVEAIKHKGFSLVNVFQPCVTFNYLNTYKWFYERVYRLEDTSYTPNDKVVAFQKALELETKLPTGIIYKTEKPLFEESLPQIKEKPLIDQPIDNIDIERLFSEFR